MKTGWIFLLSCLTFLGYNTLFAEVSSESFADFLKQYHTSNEKRAKGYSELGFALIQEKPEIADLLIESGSNVNEIFDEGTSSPISLAIEKGYDALVQKMAERKGDVNLVIRGIYDECMPQAINEAFPKRVCGPDHYSLLQIAIKAHRPSIAAILLRNGANPNFLSPMGYRPIHLAIRHEQPEIVRLLVTRGVDTNAIDLWGFSPLHYVAFLPKDVHTGKYAELLVERGADINKKIEAPIGKFAPLHLAAFNNHNDLIQVLIQYSAKVDLEDSQGCTPLWCSIRGPYESPDIIKTLVTAGANPNRLNRFQMVGPPPNLYFYTPLSLAIAKNKLQAAKALLENGADPNQMDGNGETPLLVAVHLENHDAIALLLQFKANPSTKNRLGDSPIDRAVDKNNVALLDQLIEGQVKILSR